MSMIQCLRSVSEHCLQNGFPTILKHGIKNIFSKLNYSSKRNVYNEFSFENENILNFDAFPVNSCIRAPRGIVE